MQVVAMRVNEYFLRLIVLLLLLTPICARAQGPVAPSSPAPAVNLRRTLVVNVVEKTKDAVVFISTTRTMMVRDDPFSFFLGPTHPQRVGTLGSGFIIHKDGYVVTNHHVIDRARQITVELLDGRKLPAELISSDPEADLAILKIKSDKPLPTLELGDSSDLMIGEPTIAVGNPLGYSHSVSTGIVSALHRNLSDNDRDVKLNDLIQTDAAINPGNSGGPLLNAYGQVIGVNTAIRSDAQNIGFAIQINRLRDLIPQLMNPEHANRMTLPITLTESRKITEPNIVQSTVRIAGSDEIVQSIAGQHPHDIVDAYAILLRQAVGQKFQIVTDKGTRDVVGKPIPTPDVIVQAKEKLGLTLEQMTPLLAGKEGLALDDGLYVTGVMKDSIGGRALLKPGDLIIQLGDSQPPTLEDLAALLQHVPGVKGQLYVGLLRKDERGRSHVWQTRLEF